MYPDIFESATFFLDAASVRRHLANSTGNPDIFNLFSTAENNKSATNPITRGRVNTDIFESDEVAKSCPVSYQTINQYGRKTATTEQICSGACSEGHFTPEKSWVQE